MKLSLALLISSYRLEISSLLFFILAIIQFSLVQSQVQVAFLTSNYFDNLEYLYCRLLLWDSIFFLMYSNCPFLSMYPISLFRCATSERQLLFMLLYSCSSSWNLPSSSFIRACIFPVSSTVRALSFLSLSSFLSSTAFSLSRYSSRISWPSFCCFTILKLSLSKFDFNSALFVRIYSICLVISSIFWFTSWRCWGQTIFLNLSQSVAISPCIITILFLLFQICLSIRANSSLAILTILFLGLAVSIIWWVSLFIFFSTYFSLDCSVPAKDRVLLSFSIFSKIL